MSRSLQLCTDDHAFDADHSAAIKDFSIGHSVLLLDSADGLETTFVKLFELS